MNILDCFKHGLSSVVRATPCRSSAQIWGHLLDYIKDRTSGTKNYAYATTITIGRKWLGRKSSKEQYYSFVRAIKKHIPYNGDMKYFYTFELQKNGQLHAHGIEWGTNQARFIESFYHFGSLNTKSQSFQPLRNVDGYFKYIQKDQVYPRITNIKKKDIKNYIKRSSKGRAEETKVSTLEDISL